MTRRNESFTVGELARVDIDLATGSVQVSVGDTGHVEVELDASSPDAFDISQLGDTIAVRAPSGWFARGAKANVQVVVPARTELSVNVASAEVTTRGELGAMRLRSASSTITVESAGRVEAHSASGDVRIGAAAELIASSASGDVRAGRVTGQLRASSASGDVNVEYAGGDIDVNTTSGDIRLKHCNGDDINLKTVSGDIAIGLPSGIRVVPDISTLSGHTSLPKGPVSSAEMPRRTVRLRARAVSGDVRIQRV